MAAPVAAGVGRMWGRAWGPAVGTAWLAAVLVLAALAPCEGTIERVGREWSAVNAAGLHAALGTIHTAEPPDGVVVANTSIFIDRLAFMPTISLKGNVTLGGRAAGTGLQVEARDRPLVRIDPGAAPVLTIVNFTIYLGGSEETMAGLLGGLVDAPPPAGVLFRDSTFALAARSWVLLLGDIRRLRALDGANISVVGSEFFVRDLAVGSARLRDVVLRRQSATEARNRGATLRRNVSDAAGLFEVLQLAREPALGPPVEGFLTRDVSVDEGQVRAQATVQIVGKVILSGPLDGRTMLRVAASTEKGSLAQVGPMGQLVLANLIENLTFALPGEGLCDDADAGCMLSVNYHSTVDYSLAMCDCAITLINTTILSTCEHVSNLTRSLRMFGSEGTEINHGIEVDPASDNATLRFVSYFGRGTCFANTTLTCDPGALAGPSPSPASAAPRTATSSSGDERSAIYILLGVGGGVILVCLVGLCWPPRTFCRNVAARVRRKGVSGRGLSFAGDFGESRSRLGKGSAAEQAGKVAVGGSEQCDIQTYFHEKITGEQVGVADNAVTIEEQLATGGYGVVYKGRWRGIPVAVKTVVFTDFPDAAGKEKERAILEAAISSSIAHRNVVQTYYHSFKRLQPNEKVEEGDWDINRQIKEGDWKLYIVQELCEHGSLRSALKKGLFASCTTHKKLLGAIVQIASDVASGLAHLHHHNVVHGDLNTKNVLLQHETHAEGPLQVVSKLADFGLSVKMGSWQSHVSDHRAGTPFYMAPEVAQKGVLSKKSDVFSFGVVMWEIYHQSSPVQSMGEGSLKYHEKFPKYPVTCPMLYALLCVVCLSPKPADRPDFKFIKKVLETLSAKLQCDEYTQPKNIQKENLAVVSRLNGKNGAELLQLLADQVELEARRHGLDISQPAESPPPTDTRLDMQALLDSREEPAKACLSPKTCLSSPTHPPTPSPRPHTPSGSRSPSHGPRSWGGTLNASEESLAMGSAESEVHDSAEDDQMWSIGNEPNGGGSFVISVSIDETQKSEGPDMNFAWDPVVNSEVSEGSENDSPMPASSHSGGDGYPQVVLASSESISLGISPSPLSPAGDTVQPVVSGVYPRSTWFGDRNADLLVPGSAYQHTLAPMADVQRLPLTPGTPATHTSAVPFEALHQPSFVGHRAPRGGQSSFILNMSAAGAQPPPAWTPPVQATHGQVAVQISPSVGPLGVVGGRWDSSREGAGGHEQSDVRFGSARKVQETGGESGVGGVLWTMSSFKPQALEMVNEHGRLRPGFEPHSSPPSSEKGSSMPFSSIGHGGRRP
ncbi:unnamed protein product [Ostreobium quekettii]|uniref:Protein kinase domain-containing protein n=1 Tax=Ostreobium quekettii TaxID=121088 RepID=A0A8S1IPU9_9CHLO|nr:unnamed protein product [Ostreobium quekettii]|eukprot:evm.model.scf_958.1 EVM.evm.TU.scf_958.1   scf_958:21293-25675(+)